MKRQDVFNVIEGEREYQDEVWSGSKSSRQPSDAPDALDRTIDEFALYVAGYTNDLINKCSKTDHPEEKLEIFRKVAALCVACGEAHGLPKRQKDDT